MVIAIPPPSAAAFNSSILVAWHHGGDICTFLGRKRYGTGTLKDAIMNEPGLLEKWAKSSKKTPEGKEQKAFAKLTIALYEAAIESEFQPDAAPAPPVESPPQIAQRRAQAAISKPVQVYTLPIPAQFEAGIMASKVYKLWRFSPTLMGWTILIP